MYIMSDFIAIQFLSTEIGQIIPENTFSVSRKVTGFKARLLLHQKTWF